MLMLMSRATLLKILSATLVPCNRPLHRQHNSLVPNRRFQVPRECNCFAQVAPVIRCEIRGGMVMEPQVQGLLLKFIVYPLHGRFDKLGMRDWGSSIEGSASSSHFPIQPGG